MKKELRRQRKEARRQAAATAQPAPPIVVPPEGIPVFFCERTGREVRHGRPEDGTLHVDKQGVTCSAGAGSIQTGNWHGFLRAGRLVM